MDFLGSSSDEEDGPGGAVVESPMHSFLLLCFTELVKLRSRTKSQTTHKLGDIDILIVDKEANGGKYSDSLVSKLQAAKFHEFSVTDTAPECATLSSNAPIMRQYDAVVALLADTPSASQMKGLVSSVLPGFQLYLTSRADSYKESSYVNLGCSILSTHPYTVHGVHYVGIVAQKRSMICNTKGALYWANRPDHIEREAELIENICVPLSSGERRSAALSEHSHKAGAAILKKYGVVIFCGIFDSYRVKIEQIGGYARADLKLCQEELLRRGIDITKPGTERPMINNYHELSMREALRVDLRNGLNMKHTPIVIDEGEEPVAPQFYTGFRSNESVIGVLREVMNPEPKEVPREFKGGNWGRWNFGGAGPDASPPDPTVGEMGCVMSMPGCLDQTIHADSAHLFDHVQLPAHYVNMFIPAISSQASEAEYTK